jgi:DNA-binding response OmpR family regulator
VAPPPHILLVEDEPAIGSLVRRYLEAEGWRVTWTRDGAAALQAAASGDFGLAVLDLGLPDVDGLVLVRHLAGRVPVIALTARSEEPERLAGFAAGVDDYLGKPFSPRELVARARAVLRRHAPPAAPASVAHGGVVLTAADRRATTGGRAVELTPKEFDLAWVLLAEPARVHTREALLERVWGHAGPGSTRTVDQHVAQLRRKLGADGLIETVRGLGYRAGPA